jgi:hypothetical protein
VTHFSIWTAQNWAIHETAFQVEWDLFRILPVLATVDVTGTIYHIYHPEV